MEKRTNTGVFLPRSANLELGPAWHLVALNLELAVRADTHRMHDALGNALAIEAREFFDEVMVLQQHCARGGRPFESVGCR